MPVSVAPARTKVVTLQGSAEMRAFMKHKTLVRDCARVDGAAICRYMSHGAAICRYMQANTSTQQVGRKRASIKESMSKSKSKSKSTKECTRAAQLHA